ncbi:MAG: CDP-alcohol phosphatidyltransferase family protein [Cytophagaceae bacterium]
MNIKKHIPNFLTCCNLLCGCLGIIIALNHDLIIPCYLIFAACVFDFLDGFVARLLKVQSPIGKELDSLADVVTFGVLPGIIIFELFQVKNFPLNLFQLGMIPEFPLENTTGFQATFLPFISLLIPIFSALRLAKFNIDTRQSESFIGVPTPANAILVASLPMILKPVIQTFMNTTWTIYPPLSALPQSNSMTTMELGPVSTFILNPVFLSAYCIIMSYLLVAELPLFALKFKHFKWTGNEIRFIFLVLSILLLSFLKWLGIPIIIFLYIILSLVDNVILKKSIKTGGDPLK